MRIHTSYTTHVPTNHPHTCPHPRALIPRSCATICLGVTGGTGEYEWLGYVTGALTILNGIFNLVIICVHPGFGAGGLSRWGDPTESYTDGGKEIMSASKGAASTFVKNNPDLAKQAAQGAVGYAVANPQATAGALQVRRGREGEQRKRGGRAEKAGRELSKRDAANQRKQRQIARERRSPSLLGASA